MWVAEGRGKERLPGEKGAWFLEDKKRAEKGEIWGCFSSVAGGTRAKKRGSFGWGYFF